MRVTRRAHIRGCTCAGPERRDSGGARSRKCRLPRAERKDRVRQVHVPAADRADHLHDGSGRQQLAAPRQPTPRPGLVARRHEAGVAETRRHGRGEERRRLRGCAHVRRPTGVVAGRLDDRPPPAPTRRGLDHPRRHLRDTGRWRSRDAADVRRSIGGPAMVAGWIENRIRARYLVTKRRRHLGDEPGRQWSDGSDQRSDRSRAPARVVSRRIPHRLPDESFRERPMLRDNRRHATRRDGRRWDRSLDSL